MVRHYSWTVLLTNAYTVATESHNSVRFITCTRLLSELKSVFVEERERSETISIPHSQSCTML